jgi:tRNA(Arg) A34 adenosine deaminase TadA
LTDTDQAHLRRAIELADEARRSGDQPFGSLLVGPDGRVLAEDRNTVMTERDISAHPELKLARWAARHLDLETARGTTMYTSCQPCGMCAGAIERSGLGRVVFALSAAQLAEIQGSPRAVQPVREEGPILLDEGRLPVERFLETHGCWPALPDPSS